MRRMILGTNRYWVLKVILFMWYAEHNILFCLWCTSIGLLYNATQSRSLLYFCHIWYNIVDIPFLFSKISKHSRTSIKLKHESRYCWNWFKKLSMNFSEVKYSPRQYNWVCKVIENNSSFTSKYLMTVYALFKSINFCFLICTCNLLHWFAIYILRFNKHFIDIVYLEKFDFTVNTRGYIPS